MKLPYGSRARVERRKIIDYLLPSSHPDGSGKARFSFRFGFTGEGWEIFARALKKHGRVNPVSASVESRHGTRYSVDGPLETPDGRNPKVRTVWILATRSKSPRLITAHPVEEDSMIKEHDRVVLKKGIREQGLKTGDVGTVVHVYKNGGAFEVEFVSLYGETVAIATLDASQIRPVQKREITHARLLRA